MTSSSATFGSDPIDPDSPPARHLAGSLKLVQLTRELASRTVWDEIVTCITETACAALDCERASVYRCDPATNELFTQWTTDLEIEEIRVPMDHGITGWVAQRQKIANVPDARVDARWNSAFDRRTGFETRSILAAPLISLKDHSLLGVLQLLNKRQEGFDSFDEQLLQAFALHTAVTLDRMSLTTDADWATTETMGRNVQHRFLPDRLPEIPGYELSAWWQHAEHVCGDYHEVLPLADGRTGLVVADVSGQGIGASLVMSGFRSLLSAVSHLHSEPAQITSVIGDLIDRELTDDRFITLLLIAIDPHQHRFMFSNAGHCPGLLYHSESETVRRLTSTRLPIGFGPAGARSVEEPYELSPGDLLLMYTDGVAKPINESGEMFGHQRVESFLQAHSTLSPAELVAALRREINDFCDSNPNDDLTFVVLKRSTD